MSGMVRPSGSDGGMGSEMSLLESLLPSVLVDWTPLHGYGYSERHALLFRLTCSIRKTVYDALRERRLKLTPSRYVQCLLSVSLYRRMYVCLSILSGSQ